jgi:hypothetical protein
MEASILLISGALSSQVQGGLDTIEIFPFRQMGRIIPEVPFVAAIRVADSWRPFGFGDRMYGGNVDLDF